MLRGFSCDSEIYDYALWNQRVHFTFAIRVSAPRKSVRQRTIADEFGQSSNTPAIMKWEPVSTIQIEVLKDDSCTRKLPAVADFKSPTGFEHRTF